MNIIVFGDPILSRKAEPVTVFDDALRRSIDQMHQLMVRAPGVGLAAPQVGISKRIAIVDLSIGEDPKQLYVLVNPDILQTSGSQKGEEGCLSFPDITTIVDRPMHISIRAQNVEGKQYDIKAEGFLARALCHEIDHLDGVLMLDRISRLKREIVRKKVKKRQNAGTWRA